MITTALSVGSDGAINLGAGPTFGILLAILFTHGIVCSAATAILARLNIFYVIVNGVCRDGPVEVPSAHNFTVGTTIAAIVALLVCSGNSGQRVSTDVAFTMYENNTGWSNSKLGHASLEIRAYTSHRCLGVPPRVHCPNVDSNRM